MERIKILIGYDGSACAEIMLADLLRAGLPRKADVVVLSVSEELIPAPASIGGVTTPFPAVEFRAEQEALTLARSARAVLKPLFPDWHIHTAVATGSPASALLQKADEWQPELLVVGSHGRTALGRFFFGSVSQKVLHEARCSVRVARGVNKNADDPVRLVVGVDGSPGAAAVNAITSHRHWPKGSEVLVVAALGLFPPSTFPPLALEHIPTEVGEWIEIENQRIQEAAETALRRLQGVGLKTEKVIQYEDPKSLLCEEAERWGADCIFVGAKGMGRLERMLIGSVSSSVAARAHCSVEVVRQ